MGVFAKSKRLVFIAFIILLSEAAVMLLTETGHAGEKLYLKSGVVDIRALKLPLPLKQDSPSHYFILQFKNPISPSDEAQLKRHGIKILRYIPDDAYVVRANDAQIATVSREIQNIKEFSGYVPEIRLSSELKVRSVFNRDLLQDVRLQFFQGVKSSSIAQALAKQGITVQEVTPSAIAARVATRDLTRVASFEGVEWISLKPQMKPQNFVIPHNDEGKRDNKEGEPVQMPANGDFTDLTGYESGTQIMNFQRAWAKDWLGRGQIVAISDTGLDTGEISTLARDFSHFKVGYALGYSSTSWADDISHGTHVAGSVGGTGELSKKLVLGGAYEAPLIMQSLWSREYGSLTTPVDLGVIFSQAYDAGARIHSNSWGDPVGKGLYSIEASQVDQFVWDHPDMLILFAAGNEGIDLNRDGRVDSGSVNAPATAKNILSVGASENLVHQGGVQKKLGDIAIENFFLWPVEPLASDTFSNNPQGLVAFSSRGPTEDGRLKPDLVAPGSNILSNCSSMPLADELWGRYNKDYCYSGGTSMSTPLTAAAAAIVRQRLIREGVSDGQPSAALIKAILLHTAQDLYPGQFGEIGKDKGQEILQPAPNFDQGYGRVDVEQAVRENLQFIDNKVGIATNESSTHLVPSTVHKITLVYTDAPAGPTVQKALVNNLDLEVQRDGRIFTSKSDLDNTEQIILDENFSFEPVRITVRGVNIPMGRDSKQPYALVFH